MTQAFLVTDKFGKKSNPETAPPKPAKISKLPDPAQSPVPAIAAPSPARPWCRFNHFFSFIIDGWM